MSGLACSNTFKMFLFFKDITCWSIGRLIKHLNPPSTFYVNNTSTPYSSPQTHRTTRSLLWPCTKSMQYTARLAHPRKLPIWPSQISHIEEGLYFCSPSRRKNINWIGPNTKKILKVKIRKEIFYLPSYSQFVPAKLSERWGNKFSLFKS